MRSETRKPPTFAQSARRAQIVTCAIEVIAEVGWAQASIRKIADRVGVAMSVVVYHFGNKENLDDAIIEEVCRTASAVVAPAVTAESTAAGKLNAFIRASIAYFDTHRVHLTALTQISASYTHDDGRSFRGNGLAHGISAKFAALDPTAILTAGQQDRQFGDFSVPSMAIALRGAVNAAIETILRDPDFDTTAYGEDLVAIFGSAVGIRR